jgi:hypothetical protein
LVRLKADTEEYVASGFSRTTAFNKRSPQMNYGRLALAAVAATVVDMAYGFAVYGNALANQFGQHPGVYRPAADTSYMPFLMAGVFVASLAAAYIYAKGYEGRGGIQEGLRFGAVLGLFALGYAGIVNYAVLNISAALGMSMAAAAFCEWLIVGTVIGLVYKPAVAAAQGRRVGV